jgi:hypothetical protein
MQLLPASHFAATGIVLTVMGKCLGSAASSCSVPGGKLSGPAWSSTAAASTSSLASGTCTACKQIAGTAASVCARHALDVQHCFSQHSAHGTLQLATAAQAENRPSRQGIAARYGQHCCCHHINPGILHLHSAQIPHTAKQSAAGSRHEQHTEMPSPTHVMICNTEDFQLAANAMHSLAHVPTPTPPHPT